MKPKLLITLLLVILISSCKKDSQKSVSNSVETEDISLLDTLTLKLNNGEKWVANNETQIGIVKMDSIIQKFKNDETNNYLGLGNDLSKQTSFIIKSCNMKGESHDQLHVVLVPMLDKISTLKESDNIEECKSSLVELENLIESYFYHFKV